jgi:hypothetical protein
MQEGVPRPEGGTPIHRMPLTAASILALAAPRAAVAGDFNRWAVGAILRSER